MANLVRRELMETAKTVVVKIGTNVLSRDDDTLDVDCLRHIASQIHLIRESGRRVVVVSSGAVGAGIGLLGLKQRPTDLPHLQAAAAIGQAHLIRLYDDCLRPHGYHAAQLLLTANDFKNRNRYLNVRNTLSTLFELGAVPIINENDTVSVKEIRFGDNDRLAAMVTSLLRSPLLVILSVVKGLYDGDPANPDSRLVPLVREWDDSLLQLASDSQSSRGTGGMQSKLEAIRQATAVGESVIIANGKQPDVLRRILDGEEIGTLFLPSGASLSARKRWIGYTVVPKGQLLLDDGACQAILQKGRSLLAIGISQVTGVFGRGELVSLCRQDGQEIARGLTNYDSKDIQQIAGRRTGKIAETLGNAPYTEVVHRDNLVVLS
ncbi:MAG: glutamate 5-kinase [Planctomycetaceae bacterium]|nr:glutamate 5-kinase [Planctomycetaceae bacterium]